MLTYLNDLFRYLFAFCFYFVPNRFVRLCQYNERLTQVTLVATTRLSLD